VLGYRGCSCEDDTEAASEAMQKLYTALLTLSNLGFLPAIIVACWRWYFVEAVAYVANMIFSTVWPVALTSCNSYICTGWLKKLSCWLLLVKTEIKCVI